MLNSSGITVAHYDQEKVINLENPIKMAKSDPSLEKLAEITQHIINGETGFGNYQYNGEKSLVAYAPVENSKWYLAITVHENEILSTLNSLKKGLFTISIIFLLIGLVTVYFITLFIVKQVTSITSQLNVLAEGDFSVKQEFKIKKKQDEIEEAHHSLYMMQESISNMIRAIQGTSEVIADNTDNLTSVSQQMASASENISYTVQETSKATASQAAGLSDINQIINSFGEKIDNIVINIEDIDSNTKEINQMSTSGNKNMTQLIESINIVSKAFVDFTIFINTTDELSKELEMQVDMIKNAIESYRNIVTAITDIGDKIQTVNVSAGEIDSEKIQILDRVSDASSVSEQVAASSGEISTATEQLNASSIEVANSAEKLNNLTKNMQEQVGNFKV